MAFIIDHTCILELADCGSVNVEDVGSHRKDGQTMNKKGEVIRCYDCGKELKSMRKEAITHRCSGCWSRWRATKGKRKCQN